eukprot:CAMPEP_0119569542 /NCGR_PEP_ID=MMETSP1352-20130426/41984_1 /TAXON_ID=265584 /ORGANISM="Stauroneis constricta, Strain CCMP1120" /LENGTH=164 /DNA_ID=CAMNT_0007619107 /DNA_START=60 /DNA_END=551 /DNA_ORIENTATION=+
MKYSAIVLGLVAASCSMGMSVAAKKCGNPWREPCLSDTDRRYDENANYDIKAQHDIWKHYEGYYECDMIAYDQDGVPIIEAEYDIPNVGQMNFSFFPHKVFNNISTIGTRTINHRLVILPPASGALFGVARGFDLMGTSTFELDGRVLTLPYQTDRVVTDDSFL